MAIRQGCQSPLDQPANPSCNRRSSRLVATVQRSLHMTANSFRKDRPNELPKATGRHVRRGTAPLSCARAIGSGRNAPAEALQWRWNHPILADLLPSTSILALESKASTKRPVFHPFADHFGERERRVSPARTVSEEGVSLHLQGQASAAFNAVEAFGKEWLKRRRSF